VGIEHQVRGEAIRLGYGQHKIECPSCGDDRKKRGQKTLSLRIEHEKTLYQCWHCGQNGVLPFTSDMPNINHNRSKPVAVAQKRDWNNLTESSIKFLKSRGISEKTAEKLQIKVGMNYIQSVGRETECVIFPYLNQGQEYAAKIRSIESKGFACNGSPQSFFNIQNVQPNDWMFITEGEFDCAALVECGYESAVSMPNGAPIKVVDGKIDPKDDNKFRFIWEAKKQIDMAERIVICTDADSAGQAAAEEIARRIGKDRCWVIDFPEGCKDANDVLLKHGKQAVDDMITNCRPWPISGLYDSSHFFEQLDEIYDKGMGRGESTGYKNVDDLFTVASGQLTVVTGHPSSGKSEFVDQLMINLAQSKSWKFAICSFENEPRLHIAKLISKHLKRPFFDGPTARMTKEELNVGKEFVQSHFSFLHQSDGSLSTMDSILERIKIAVMRHGVRGVVIDPYNYIQKPSDVAETEWISVMLSQVRLFAQAHGLHIWFVAHPTKMMRDAKGKVPSPTGYDISGSAAWFAKADIGITVHRPEPAKSVLSQVICWKCRFSWIGKQGQTDLIFNKITSCYTDSWNDVSAESSTYTSDEDDEFL
jgi:twinkle protein